MRRYFYREALKLGLDKNDIIIKRRLAQKIGFLRQEADSSLPSEDEVKDFYNQNIDKYFVGKGLLFLIFILVRMDQISLMLMTL